MTLEDRFRRIRLILSDVDGVLTDGGLCFDNQGIESKQFHIRDGLGIRLWQRAGYPFGMITGRSVADREDPRGGIGHRDRAARVRRQTARPCATWLNARIGADETCYIGDDLPDWARCAAGLGVAVADACGRVREAADYVTHTPGGRGAVREIIEWSSRPSTDGTKSCGSSPDRRSQTVNDRDGS